MRPVTTRRTAPADSADPTRRAPSPRRTMNQTLRSWLRALPAGLPAVAGAAALAAPAAAAGPGEGGGVVRLSSGPVLSTPTFGAPADAWVGPAAAADTPAAPASGVIPAGYVAPAAAYSPAGELPATAGPLDAAFRSAHDPTGGLYDPAVTPVQYETAAPYCPPGAAGPGGPPVGGPIVGGNYGGVGTQYRARGGRKGRPRSLWTTITRYRPPQGTFARIEYLAYSMSGEEVGTVGADVQGVTTEERSVIFPDGRPVLDDTGDFTRPFSAPFGPAVIPALTNNDLDQMQGVRVTIGRPVRDVGRFEVSGFAFAQETFALEPDLPLFPQTTFASNIALGLTIDDQPGQIVTIFDDSYRLEYETEFWGAGGRMVFDHLARPEGFGMRPLVGARYMMLNQNLFQFGTFDAGGTTVPLDREISTTAHNNVFGAELGVEAELRHKWFTAGVRPALTVGVNEAQVRTRSVNFTGVADGVVRNTQKYTEFSPIFDLAAYLRVPLGDSVRLNVGYDLLWIARVARPNDSTNYDAVGGPFGIPAASNIRPRKVFDDATFNGFTIGVELIFP